jgi:anti-anti-sigma regulatory factor
VIAVLLRKAIGSQRRLYACGLSEHFREIFRITRLSDYITLCTNEKRALEEIEMSLTVPSLLPE